MVKELKKAGIRFTLHVVGFDVTEEERLQLECMAKAGGGEYYTAKTAHEFRAAAQDVVRKTQEQGFLRLTALRGDTPIRAAVEVRAAGGDPVAPTRTRPAPACASGPCCCPTTSSARPGARPPSLPPTARPGGPTRPFSTPN